MNRKGSLTKRRFEGGWRGIAWMLAALMVALMLAAAGCGDDDDDDAPADSGGGAADTSGGDASGVATFEPGQEFRSVFIPKQTGIAVFEQANNGAQEAAQELQVEEAEFLGPSSPDNCVSSQIDTVTNAGTQGVNGVMISNCAGDQIEPAARQAADAGAAVVSWDSRFHRVRARASSSPRWTSTRPAR
jgi:ABC-type sugar transport system substrate-binding protein